MVSVEKANIHIVELLLLHGADPSIRCTDGQLPMEAARELVPSQGAENIILLLEEYMSSPEGQRSSCVF